MQPTFDFPGNDICIVMAHNMSNYNYVQMSKFAIEVNTNYCYRYGYGFRVYNEGFAIDRHPSWSKLLFVRDALETYQWVFWIDTDAIITNPTITLESFLDSNYMLILGKQNWDDPPWNSINFGVFFIQQDEYVDEFVERVWADIDRPGRVGWEQDGVCKVIKEHPFDQKVKIVPRRSFNSVVYHESLMLHKEFNHETEAWHKGDFVAHFGGKRPDMLQAMQEMLAECEDL